MRYFVRLAGAICCALGLWAATSAAQTDKGPTEADGYYQRGLQSSYKGELDRAIADFTEAIRLDPKSHHHFYRAEMYRLKGDYDRAIVGFSESLRLGADKRGVYTGRAEAYRDKGDYDRALGEYDEYIKLSPDSSEIYARRGRVYQAKGDYDRAIADYSKAMKLDPNNNYGGDFVLVDRGDAYRQIGDHGRAVADYNSVIKIYSEFIVAQPDWRFPAYLRGRAYQGKGDYDRAIADYNEAIRRKGDGVIGDNIVSFYRGKAYEAKGDRSKAIEDYSKFLTFPAKTKQEKDQHAAVSKRLAALQPVPPPPTPIAVTSPPAVTLGRRVALVIGNAAYRGVGALPNPINDARSVALALRAAGFTEVVEHYDLGVQQMRDVLKTFEDKATGADWAVVYYAGHGIEVDGRNYLIPVDAALKSASDVEDETLPLDRVLARVAVAKRLQLVILDACRDNPFAPRMAQPGTIKRNIGKRGLARIEPEHPNLFIAYSARHGEAALDGSGKNSPYAKALVKHLAMPGLPLTNFFIRVRTEVLAETSGKQRPFEYGSLTDENLFFRPAAK